MRGQRELVLATGEGMQQQKTVQGRPTFAFAGDGLLLVATITSIGSSLFVVLC